MPAGLPGDSAANNAGNPTLGPFVIFDPLSGPKGAPLDSKKIDYSTGTPPGWNAATRVPILISDPTNVSTGGLSTGIGIGAQHMIGLTPDLPVLTPIAYSIFKAGFDDDMVPGERQAYAAPPPPGNTSSNTIDSNRMYIGGGRMIANTGTLPVDKGRPFLVSPYTAGIALVGAGNGGSRDGGAGPAFTGFPMKMVSNTGTAVIANGGTIEGTFVNRSGGSLAISGSAFGSSNAALAAAA